ncbi:MFS general substrate transporter [Paraphaeosphaeria sporulosa]|uniref:MFS general substrate transporter n=1 Tax=Paraphaeosphaeria sporulosa TaxID=1460663 RepID=A0A177C2K5_9PLEO|nr:MFS general substrate transporter [Paraphaeosphaeria sporulosa]OAG02024.1 MFS general substrate transporter [Paraphaeosphaeria sporulosa]
MSTSLNFRIAATMFSFMITGLFNASIGVMLAPMSRHYSLTDLHVSFIFLCGPIGYVLASPSNASIHTLLGQRGIALIGPLLHTLAALGIAAHPPFTIVLVAFVVNAMGIGLVDGSWCAWAGGLEKANVVSGLLHGSYSAGAAIGPFVAGVSLGKLAIPWWDWYYVLAGASVLELIILATAFRFENASRYHASKSHITREPGNTSWKDIFRHPGTWFSATYFLTYVGIETAISGWVVSFMVRSRHASTYFASLSSSGFWAGMAVGRLTLGHITDRIGVRRAAAMYLLCAIGLLLLFALISSPVVSIIVMASAGFVMGPLFPSGVVVLSELLPWELHVAAVSFVASVGQIGGAALPFGIGAVVQGLGIGVFRWIILIFSCIALSMWILFAQLKPRDVARQRMD